MRYVSVNLAETKKHNLQIEVIDSMTDDLLKVMKLCKEELRWNDMYDEEEAISRFKDGCMCILYYEQNIPLGLCWFYDVRPNLYTFNWFMSKKRKVKKTAKPFLDACGYELYKRGYHHWVAYIDDWNDFAFNATKTFDGYRSISVHQFNEMIKGARKKLYF